MPLARYLALNNVVATKRYTIGRSYRRDQPQANRGRYREFYQADFDIVGKYAPMAADAEVLKVGPCHAVFPRQNSNVACWSLMGYTETISGICCSLYHAQPSVFCLIHADILQRHLPTWALPDKSVASCDRLRCGLQVVSSILLELKVGDFLVKVSHRKLLDAMLTYCGVPKEKFHPICSAIDKLDKEPWDTVRAEMVDQKGLPADVRSTT